MPVGISLYYALPNVTQMHQAYIYYNGLYFLNAGHEF